jgi:hypothetical protein
MRLAALGSVIAATLISWSAVGVASAAVPKCADLGGTVDSSQMCQIQATDPAYSLNISFPVLYPDQKTLFDYVRQTRDGFLNVAKMPDSRTMPYELDVTATEYSSAVPPRGTQSVVLKTYQSVGGAHPQTFYKAFNWDQGLRKAITIDTLFQSTAQPFPVIFPVVQDELAKQLGTADAVSPAAGLDPTTYQNFAITNDALIFFFDQGQLLPEAAGAISVSVPRAPIDSMIA